MPGISLGSLFHLSIWWVLLVVLPLAAAHLAFRGASEARHWLVGDTLAPALVGLVWIHACWFAPPRNSAMIDEYGFFGFWFHLRSESFYSDHWTSLLAWSSVASIPLAVAIVGLLRRRAKLERSAARYLACATLALSARVIPSRAIDSLGYPLRADDGAAILFFALPIGFLALTVAILAGRFPQDR